MFELIAVALSLVSVSSFAIEKLLGGGFIGGA
jgi:hypothetical protein